MTEKIPDEPDDDKQRLQRLASFGQLGAGITHEVKNVMTGILGFAQVALRRSETEAPQLVELLRSIESESLRCLEILAGFLDLAREGTTRSRVELNDVVTVVTRLVRHQPREAAGELQVLVELGEVPPVSGNPGELQQVIFNLMLNAIQAMSDRSGVVRIATRSDGKDVLCEVTDEGPGVAPEVEASLFKPFFTTKEKGTGLGLFVSRTIVERHGGSLVVRNAPVRGATFTVRLPAA